ncbi:pectinesterase-like [Papaver somniferum]|nr:pectinesterase-like [Papaver somniferum]
MVEYSKKQVGPASAAIDSVEDASNLIRNPLSIISNPAEYDFLVAKDGSGNFSSIQEAVDHSPTRSFKRTVIRIRQGVYVENIVIPKEKINLYFVGDGRDVTIISGNRNQVHGYTIMTSATVGVEGDGFLARDITFENTAGPANFQAVALRINADASAVYRCNINGYQDTLFVQSFRQYFRECNISGTIDFIFGDSAVVFQQCNIITRLPSQGQYNAITASGRVNPDGKGGIVIQNCSILASEDLKQSNYTVETYLGRPWKACARTVIMKSYLDNLVHPKGWIEWEHNSSSVDSLWYGEYRNTGPGAKNDSRVEWKNYHKVMSIDEAFSFTVSEFIAGNEWLDSTGFPYQTGI